MDFGAGQDDDELPDARAGADSNHWLGFKVRFFEYSGAAATGQNDYFHEFSLIIKFRK